MQVWSLFSKSSSKSLFLSPTGHLAQGRARYVVGTLRAGAILPTLSPTQSSVGNRGFSPTLLPVSRVHQLRSEAQFLEALIAYHDDNGGGRG